MQKQILEEISQLRKAVAHVIGTADHPAGHYFSLEALDKAAKEFQKLSIEREDWVEDDDISKHIKDAPWRAGKFIREEFGFSRFFKRGSKFYYYKKDLIDLAQELKKRNVNLKRYIELKEDQEKFLKYLSTVKENIKSAKTKKSFDVPEYVKDIVTSPAKLPSKDVVQADLNELQQEFFNGKYGDYIDIHKGNYAMLKYIYHFERYIQGDLKRRLNKWCQHFNTANEVLKEITGKRQKFIPVPDENMIRL